MKIIKKSIFLIISMLLCMSFVCSACSCKNTEEEKETISIVKSGLSGYTIVIPEEATECEEYSASELVYFINQSSGVTLDVVKDSTVSYNSLNKIISIGNTTLKESANVAMQDGLKSDAYAITVVRRAVYIYGNSDRANLYGVYEFLEDCVGVRFLTTDYTYVPENQDIKIEASLNLVKNPAFDQRQYWTNDAQTDARYAARKRLVTYWNWSDAQYGYGMYRDFEAVGHNVISLLEAGAKRFGLDAIPDNAYATDINGNRMSADINGTTTYDVCWTDGIADDGTFIEEVKVNEDGTKQPTAAQLLLEGLKNSLITNKTATIFCIMQEDTSSVVCDCERCHANKTKYNAMSSSIIRMMNALTVKINEYNSGADGDGRDIRIATYAYSYSQEAPVFYTNGEYFIADSTVIPNDHVIIEYCTMDGCNHTLAIDDANQSAFHKDCLSKWEWLCKDNKNLAIYTYTANFNCEMTYLPNLKTIKENIVYIYENLNTDMVTFENSVYAGDWQQSLRAYIASELFWDPYADVEPLIDEFITLTYGRSAEVVKSYIDRMEVLCDYNRSTYGSEFYLMVADSTEYMIHQAKFWPIGVLETSINELKAEITAVENDDTLSQTEKKRLTKELKKVLISPMMTVKFNYEAYYGLVGDKDAFIAELKSLISEFSGISQQVSYRGLM